MQQQQRPQLRMIRRNLDNLPLMVLPEGCALKTYGNCRAEDWQRIVADSFGGEATRFSFEQMVAGNPGYSPDGVFFVALDGTPVATASAVLDPEKFPGYGVIHYVGVCPTAQGKRLGYWVSLAALQFMRESGLRGATLLTDDHRLPALKTYLRLGFEPWPVHDNQSERWRLVFSRLGQHELAERYRTVLEGPVWSSGMPLP